MLISAPELMHNHKRSIAKSLNLRAAHYNVAKIQWFAKRHVARYQRATAEQFIAVRLTDQVETGCLQQCMRS